MFKFFDGLMDIIGTVIDFVVGMIESLIMIVTQSARAVVYILEVLAFLPAYVKVYILAMVGASAILFIINKGGN